MEELVYNDHSIDNALENKINDVHFEYSMGNFAEAFSKGVMLQEKFPNNPTLHNLVGASEMALGDPKAAASSYARAIEVDPDFIDSYINLASLYNKLGMSDEALSVYKLALKVDNTEPAIYYNLGNLLLDKKMYKLSQESYSEAIKFNPNYDDAHYNLGCSLVQEWKSENLLTLEELGQYSRSEIYDDSKENLVKAKYHLEESKDSNYDNPEYFNLIGEIQFNLGKQSESEKNFKRAISVDKCFAAAYVNLAKLRYEEREFSKSITLANTALAVDSKSRNANLEKAKSLFNLGEVDKSVKIYEKVISQSGSEDTEFIIDSYNLGLALASLGKFEKAWEFIEYRFDIGIAKILCEKFNRFPKWDGKDGGPLALWQDQGIGDVFFYASIIDDVLDVCDDVTVFLDDRLIESLKYSFPKIKFRSIKNSIENENFNAQLALGSLPSIFRKDISQFNRLLDVPIKPNPADTDFVQNLLQKHNKVKCGLAWFSKAKQEVDDRTIPLDSLLSVLDSNKFDLINLQYPDDAKAAKVAKHQAKKLKNIPGINLKDDFSKVIALIDCCDIIISIDNTIAHIASALGKQTIVLLPLAPPNFRWLLNGRNTPWYPNTTSLIRKDKIGDWSDNRFWK